MERIENIPGLRNHSLVLIDDNIVLFGGEDSDDEDNNLFRIYN